MPFPFHDFISSTSILCLCGLLLGAGLIYSKMIDVPTGLMIMIGAGAYFGVHDFAITTPQMGYIIPIVFLLGFSCWFISKLPRRKRKMSYRILIVLVIGLFAYGIYCYIDVLSMVLFFICMIALLIGALFYI
jgi:hypothetical protein